MAKSKAKTVNGSGANGSAPGTSQRLGGILKSARDIMRKDKGLNGDLDRIPVLTWIMFLKFLDDMESMRAEEAKLAGKRFKPAIESPYRWRDWAAKEDGITGDELIAFINQEESRRPDGSKGAGLFAYLRALRGAEGLDRRDVIATVFKGTVNRMINGYLLRDVINKVNGIHFTSSDEIHTLGNFYESMLKEMRDAAGDSGEFYTPRAVVRFMVDVIDPKIGETVLDPACGTGGFLVEAFSHMEKQCKTVQQRRQLQQSTIIGGEAKSLPFLLAQMNLLLHGLETPRVEPGNSLAVSLREIGDKDRVDVILTNPPFGGEEERGILSNFPEDKQTAETALLFLQLIMRKLRRAPKPGRAAVVVPNGTLYADGVGARIKEELLSEFNLHTIVRLPPGVFAPYTPIPTNILFFDRSGPTKDIWFYEQPLPVGRKTYTKTNLIRFEEFTPCLEWWNARVEGPNAWRTTASDVVLRHADGSLRAINLDIKNPSAIPESAHIPVVDATKQLLSAENEIVRRLSELEQDLERSAQEHLVQLDPLLGRTDDLRADISPVPLRLDCATGQVHAILLSIASRLFYEAMLREHPAISLGEIATISSGGTPSTQRSEFWGGEIPWVAPKDMKSFLLAGTSSSLTGTAVKEGAARLIDAPASLLVTRGMILARYVPVVHAEGRVAVNQDIRVVAAHPGFDRGFISAMLLGAERHLFAKVTDSTAGQRRIETHHLESLRMPSGVSEKEQQAIGKTLAQMSKSLDDFHRVLSELPAALRAVQPQLQRIARRVVLFDEVVLFRAQIEERYESLRTRMVGV